MDKRKLVSDVILRKNEDFVTGEILISLDFARKIVEDEYVEEHELIGFTSEILGLDIATAHLDSHCLKGDFLEDKLKMLEKMAALNICPMVMVNGPFSMLSQEIGLMKVLSESLKDSEHIKREINKNINLIIEVIDRSLNKEAGAIIIGEDLAYSNKTYMSPVQIKNQIFPSLEKTISFIKDNSNIAILHSCGNIEEIIDDLVDIGIDCIHGFQPSAGMEIKKIKETYGEKVAIWGNFEPDLWAIDFNPDDTAERIKDTIAICRKNGAYIAGSAAGLHSNQDPEIIKFLYKVIREEKEKD